MTEPLIVMSYNIFEGKRIKDIQKKIQDLKPRPDLIFTQEDITGNKLSDTSQGGAPLEGYLHYEGVCGGKSYETVWGLLFKKTQGKHKF